MMFKLIFVLSLVLLLYLPVSSSSVNQTTSDIKKINNSSNSSATNDYVNSSDSQSSALISSIIQLKANKMYWSNASTHVLNTSDVTFDISSRYNLSGLTCLLMNADKKIKQSPVDCLYPNNLGHIEYQNLSGSYIFRVDANTSEFASNNVHDFKFKTPVVKVVTTPPKIKPDLSKPPFDQCEINPLYHNSIVYRIGGNTNSSVNNSSANNNTENGETKIEIYKNIANESTSGRIIAGTNEVKFVAGQLKTATDCLYYWIPSIKRTGSQNESNTSPFLACSTKNLAALYVIDVNPELKFNLSASNNTKILLGITNDYSGAWDMSGHLEIYQQIAPFYQDFTFNVPQVTTRCIGTGSP